MKEDSPAQTGAGSRVGSWGHMTLPRHLDGDLPDALIRFCPVRSENMALGIEPCLGHQGGEVLGRSDGGGIGVLLFWNHRAWAGWSLALPPAFFKLGDPGLMSLKQGSVGSRWP